MDAHRGKTIFCPFSVPSLSLWLILCAIGCNVGPDYHPQKTEMPAGWTEPPPAMLRVKPATGPSTAPSTQPTTQESFTTQDQTAIAQWWHNFGDPGLDSLIDRAIKSNLGLKTAEARVREARASRGVVGAALYPNVNTSAGYSRSGNAAASSGRDLYQAGLDASWEIDIFGSVRRSVEAANADIDVAVEDQRDVLVSLTAEVALNYFDLRSLQRQIVIAHNNLKSQQYSADLTQRRFRGGFVAGLDVANAQAQVASTESQIPLLESSARQTIYALSVLLGQQPSALLEELTMFDPPAPKVPPLVPVGLPSELLLRRPDIRRAEASIHASTARIGAATADLFPRFSLNGSFAFDSTRPKNLFDWSNRSWSVGPSVSWPLFDAGRIRANIEIQKAANEQQIFTYQQTVLTALQEVDSALVAYTSEQRHRSALYDAVAANRRAVDIAQRLYAQGQTSFLEVLNAQRSLFGSEDALAVSDRTVATNLVAVYKALGGGWEESEETQNGKR